MMCAAAAEGGDPSSDDPYYSIVAAGWSIDLICRAADWPALPALLDRLPALLEVLARQLDTTGEAAILLEEDDAIARLNAEWRGKDGPTNVLSFPSGDAPFRGDLALAKGVCTAEARAQDKPVDHHCLHLILHGLLHLLGHDHLHEADAAHMEGLERAVLAALGLPDPYEREPGA